MNCEEYVVERLKLLEKTNDSLKFLLDNQLNTINKLCEEIKAYKDLVEKCKVQFDNDDGYCRLHFNGYYSNMTSEGTENLVSIINDFKTLGIYSDLVISFEKKEPKEN